MLNYDIFVKCMDLRLILHAINVMHMHTVNEAYKFR